jgi:hypothetical protein
MKKLPLLLTLLACSILVNAKVGSPKPDHSEMDSVSSRQRLNFFIISKRKKGHLDLATRYNILRTKIRGLSHKNTFIAIIAEDMKDAVLKMKRNLEATNTKLGTVWFDSHGAFKKGYSLFYVGKDECNSHSLLEPEMDNTLQQIDGYSDNYTKVVIGSCYGGATYTRQSIDYTQTYRMDGDSLMKALSRHFNTASIYGSESWVMSKPGLFNRKPSVGGNPGRKLFLDVCYKPAWENIGRWNVYESASDRFLSSNTIALDESGNLVVRDKPYVIEKKIKKEVEAKLKKLQPGLYK